MTPFYSDPINQIASAQTLISMQKELEESLEKKLEEMREHHDRDDSPVHLLAEGQLEYLLMTVRRERMQQEAAVETMEAFADHMAKNPPPTPPTFQVPPLAHRMPTQASGLTETVWECNACGQAGSISYPPTITVAELATRLHQCRAMGSTQRVSLRLDAGELPEGYA